jgi:hypothetical protein
MKHLFSGVALAAVIAVAAPVWAQSPMTPSSPGAPPGAPPAAPSAAPGAAPSPSASDKPATARPKRPVRRPGYAAPRGIGMPGDRVADQLNRAEASRLPAPAAPIAPGYAPPGYAPGFPPVYPAPWGYPPPPPWGFPRPY